MDANATIGTVAHRIFGVRARSASTRRRHRHGSFSVPTDFIPSDHLPAVTCVDLPSPFDYQQQGRIEIPAIRHSPGDYEAHTAEVTETITSYLAEGTGGTLILITSKTQMMEVARRLPEALRRFVLIQGSDSKARLLAQHKAAIDRGERSATRPKQPSAQAPSCTAGPSAQTAAY